MPNIEVHGMTDAQAAEAYVSVSTSPFHTGLVKDVEVLEKAMVLIRTELAEVFNDAPYAKHVVITTTADDVRNLKGERDPFFRVLGGEHFLSTRKEDFKQRLKRFGFGVEFVFTDYVAPEDL